MSRFISARRACAVGATVAVCVLLPTAASAGPRPDAPQQHVTVTRLGPAELVDGARGRGARAQRSNAVRDYVDAQARVGRLVDEAVTRAAVNGDVTVVWDEGVDVSSVQVAVPDPAVPASPGEAAPPLEIAVESTVTNDADDVAPPATTGLGLEVTSGLAGGTRMSGTCVSTVVSSQTNTSCFAKYRASYKTASYDYFYYERWATGTGQAVSGGRDYSPAVIDVRSRPWAGSATTNTKQLVDYWPRAGSTGCSGSGSAGFSAAGISATVPVQDCNITTPIPNATSKTMGVIYDQGTWVSGRSHTSSFGMSVGMAKGTVANMADYTYMKFCLQNLCGGAVGNLRKDAGW